jgi:hypothetical protein
MEAPITAAGMWSKEFWPHGRDAQSIAFFKAPGIERLYSGVTGGPVQARRHRDGRRSPARNAGRAQVGLTPVWWQALSSWPARQRRLCSRATAAALAGPTPPSATTTSPTSASGPGCRSWSTCGDPLRTVPGGECGARTGGSGSGQLAQVGQDSHGPGAEEKPLEQILASALWHSADCARLPKGSADDPE